ncbi:MAG: NADH:flavin oxidoreductase [Alteromonadaceae bacterium]|nr:NADH:flavin oxidoreductase [Alteromonadaceae bacterium]
MPNNSPLFIPFNSEKLNLKNRIVMAPMTRTFSPGNVPKANVVEYYQRRAAGGVGLIITEGTCIDHKAANGYANVPFFYGEKALAGWKKVVDAVHQADGKIAPQLWHVGGIRRPGTEPDESIVGYSPSGMAMPNKVTGHAMTQDDINDVIEAFAQAALNAKNIGFDAIELHGAHGYLIDQFFWQATNVRDDQYGGNMENRGRFAVEVITAVRKAVGENFPIIFRYSQWKQQDYTAHLAQTPEQLTEFLQPLVAAGVDIFHCSSRRFWQAEFEGSNLNLAAWTQKITKKPSITVGSVGLDNDFMDGTQTFAEAKPASLDALESKMANNEFDLVAVGRALIANPDWANKVKNDETEQLKPYLKENLTSLI